MCVGGQKVIDVSRSIASPRCLHWKVVVPTDSNDSLNVLSLSLSVASVGTEDDTGCVHHTRSHAPTPLTQHPGHLIMRNQRSAGDRPLSPNPDDEPSGDRPISPTPFGGDEGERGSTVLGEEEGDPQTCQGAATVLPEPIPDQPNQSQEWFGFVLCASCSCSG